MRKICLTILFLVFFSLSFAYEPVETITITKEDIKNATPTTHEVIFTKKQLKSVEMMERRHFLRTFSDFSDKERLKNLEYELLGKTWQYSETDERIKTLEIASTNVMLRGVALPGKISSRRNAKRMTSSIQTRKKDEVGLIDGFLRLISPEKYEEFRNYSENIFNRYDY